MIDLIRKASGTGNGQNGLGAVAQQEIAKRNFDVQDVAALELFEHIGRERAARHMPDVKLGAVALARRIGHREVAALAVVENEIEMLARSEPGADASRNRRCTSITSSARRCRRNTRAVVVLRANGSVLPIDAAQSSGRTAAACCKTALGLRRARPGSARRRRRRGPRPRRRGPCRCRTRPCGRRRGFRGLRVVRRRARTRRSQGKRWSVSATAI